MLSRILVMSSLLVGPVAANAFSQELSRSKEGAIELLLKNVANLTVKNQGGVEHAERPATAAVAAALAEATSITASCTYRGKSLIEDCKVVVVEGGGGEGLGGALTTISFSVIHDVAVGKHIEILRAL